MLKMMVKTMENVSTIQASILWPKLCQKIHFSDWKSMLKRQKIVWKAPSWPKISEFLKIRLWVQFRMRADGFQDRLSGFPANPGRAGHPQNLKTDVRDLERIWADLNGSERICGYIRDNSFLAAPPCPQTPKPPDYQETGRLSIWSCSHTLDPWRVGG